MYTEFEKMSDHSRVWIYPAERNLNEAEAIRVLEYARDFVGKWTAHNVALEASCHLLQNRFLVLTVDENAHGASGCSIDSSVHFIRDLESKVGISFLNGGKVAVRTSKGIELMTTAEIKKRSAENLVDENTPVFDHLVKNMGELRSRFEVTAGQTWLNRFLLKKEEA